MFSGELIFAQLMNFLPRHEFNTCVRRYRGDCHTKSFSCRDQFLAMVFAQLTYRDIRNPPNLERRIIRENAGFKGLFNPNRPTSNNQPS